MPPELLQLLGYVFLALLYLFLSRVIRAVWVELKEPSGALSVATSSTGSRSQPQRATPMQLVIVEPIEKQGKSFEVRSELTIGRAPGCAISLRDDNFVSSLHARVYRGEQAVFVEDLGSTNGTLLNGVKLTAPRPMKVGDRLRIGDTTLELASK